MGLLIRASLKARLAAKKDIREELCLALSGPELFSSSPASARAESALGALDGMLGELGALCREASRDGCNAGRDEGGGARGDEGEPVENFRKECMDIVGRAWTGDENRVKSNISGAYHEL